MIEARNSLCLILALFFISCMDDTNHDDHDVLYGTEWKVAGSRRYLSFENQIYAKYECYNNDGCFTARIIPYFIRDSLILFPDFPFHDVYFVKTKNSLMTIENKYVSPDTTFYIPFLFDGDTLNTTCN